MSDSEESRKADAVKKAAFQEFHSFLDQIGGNEPATQAQLRAGLALLGKAYPAEAIDRSIEEQDYRSRGKS